MREQKMITRAQYQEAFAQSVPDEDEVDPPTESEQPYFLELDDAAAGRTATGPGRSSAAA